MDFSSHDPGPLLGLGPLGEGCQDGSDSPSHLDGVISNGDSAAVELLPPYRVEEGPVADVLPALGVVLPPLTSGRLEEPKTLALIAGTVLGVAGRTVSGQELVSQISKFTATQLYKVNDVNNSLQTKNSNIYKTTNQTSEILISNESTNISLDIHSKILHNIPSAVDLLVNELPCLNESGENQVSTVTESKESLADKKKDQHESNTTQLFHPSSDSYSQITSKLLPDQVNMGNQPCVQVTKECAVLIESLQNSNLDMYCRAIERQIGPNNIIFLGRAPRDMDKILVFLENHRLAEKLVRVGVNIRARWLMVSFYSLPATRVVLSDVFPFIEDEVLIKALLPYGTVATSKMRKIRAATKHPSFRNIFSYRREIYIYINKGLSLPATLEINAQGETYVVEVSTDGIKCFRCGRFGHSITFCDVPQILVEDGPASTHLKQSLSTLPLDKITKEKPSISSNGNGATRSFSKSVFNEKGNGIIPNITSETSCVNVIDGGTHRTIPLLMDGSFQLGIVKPNSENELLMELESHNVGDVILNKSIELKDSAWKEVIHNKKRKRKLSSPNIDVEFSYSRTGEDADKALTQDVTPHSDDRMLKTHSREIPGTEDNVHAQNEDYLSDHGVVPLIKSNLIEVNETPRNNNLGVMPSIPKINKKGVCNRSKLSKTEDMTKMEKHGNEDIDTRVSEMKSSLIISGSKKRIKHLDSWELDQENTQKDDRSDTGTRKPNPFIKLFQRELSKPPMVKESSKLAFRSAINPATASLITNNLMQEIKYKSEPVKATILKSYYNKYPKLMDYFKTALNCDKNTFVVGNHMHKKLTEVIGDLQRIIDPPTWDMRERTQKNKRETDGAKKSKQREESKRQQVSEVVSDIKGRQRKDFEG